MQRTPVRTLSAPGELSKHMEYQNAEVFADDSDTGQPTSETTKKKKALTPPQADSRKIVNVAEAGKPSSVSGTYACGGWNDSLKLIERSF